MRKNILYILDEECIPIFQTEWTSGLPIIGQIIFIREVDSHKKILKLLLIKLQQLKD